MRPSRKIRRTALRALLAIGIVSASACTLLESKEGLVGPPLDGPFDGFSGDDAHVEDGEAGDASVLVDSPFGDDSSDGQNVIDAATDGPKPVPITLYTDQVDPTGIFADGTAIYWVATSNTRGLFKGSRDGGLPTTIARLDDVNQSLGDAFDLVVDGTYVYWTDRKGFVYRRALTGGAYELCFNVPQPAFLAIGFGALYTTDYNLIDGGGAVFRGTCGQPVSTMFGAQPRASGIVVGTSPPDLYWGRNSSDQIAFGRLDGGAPNTFHFALGAVDGITTDGEAMYWIAESRRIMRFDFKTAHEDELFAEGASFGEGDIAVDSEWVYWTELSPQRIMKIAKVP